MNRGDAAAGWFRRDATPRPRRGDSVETSRGAAAAIPWRHVAATARPGDSVETRRGDAAAATWEFGQDRRPPRYISSPPLCAMHGVSGKGISYHASRARLFPWSLHVGYERNMLL